jgi:hypothetical protein
MKMAVFWDVAMYNLVDIDPDEGDSKFLYRSVSTRLHCAASQKTVIFEIKMHLLLYIKKLCAVPIIISSNLSF